MFTLSWPLSQGERPAPPIPAQAAALTFMEVYDNHFDFVWRSVRRLGVLDAATDDVVQEIFVVVHRRLAEFEARSSVRTWLFGIALRIVRDHRRQQRRKNSTTEGSPSLEVLSDDVARQPDERATQAEAVRLVHKLLGELDDDKRELMVLAELEQMSVPEISEALGMNLNTVYSRLRAARQAFDEAVARHRARDHWRFR